MSFYLGVDGGASKTKVVIGNQQGQILSEAEGPSSNYLYIGMDKAMEAIGFAIESAATSAGISWKNLEFAVLGLAGANLPIQFSELDSGLKRTFPGLSFEVVNDTWVALRGGTKKGWGIALVCGTGANACLRKKNGEWYTLRGLGYETGFEGGALSMVKDILYHSFRAHDGLGPPTSLEKEVLSAVGLANYEELAELVFGFFLFPSFVRPEIKNLLNLVPLLFPLANEGDVVANTILSRHGKNLGEIAGRLIQKFNLQQEELEVVMNGGVFKGNNPVFIDEVALSLHLLAPRARLVFPSYEPAVGGYLLALEKSGISVNNDIYEQLDKRITKD